MQAIKIRNAVPADAQALFNLGWEVYGESPDDYAEDEYITTANLRHHIKRFSQGVFVAEIDKQLVGYAITIRTSHRPEGKPLSWYDAIGTVNLNNHDPNGKWLYGVDFGVHPDFRKRGIGSKLYRVRFEMIRKLNLLGYYAGGMLAGYYRYAKRLTVQEYGKRVRHGDIQDPTITMQMNRGFEATEVIPNYCGQDTARDSAMLIIWRNKNYSPARFLPGNKKRQTPTPALQVSG